MSRSCRVPQDGHCHVLVLRLSSASRCPHAEQVLLDGYQRSTTIRCRPARSALYSSIWRKVPHPQSLMALASDRLRTMFLTARSSTTITSWSRTSRVLARCRKSARDALTFRCARATFAFAFARFAEPRWQRASLRWYRARFRALRSRCRGLAIFSPSEVAAKSLMPRSTPTTAPVAGNCCGSATSIAKDTYQRPHGSRETVTVVGSRPVTSTSGHDHTKASGAVVFASHSAPSFTRNALRV